MSLRATFFIVFGVGVCIATIVAARMLAVPAYPVVVSNSSILIPALADTPVETLPIEPTTFRNQSSQIAAVTLLQKSCNCFDVHVGERTIETDHGFELPPRQDVRVYLPLGGKVFPGGTDVVDALFRFEVEGFDDRVVRVSRTVRGYETVTVAPPLVTLKAEQPDANQPVTVELVLPVGQTPQKLLCPVGSEQQRTFHPQWSSQSLNNRLVLWSGRFPVDASMLMSPEPGEPLPVIFEVHTEDSSNDVVTSFDGRFSVLITKTGGISHPRQIEAVIGDYPQAIQLVADDAIEFEVQQIRSEGPVQCTATARTDQPASVQWIDVVFSGVNDGSAKRSILFIETTHPRQPLVRIPIRSM